MTDVDGRLNYDGRSSAQLVFGDDDRPPSRSFRRTLFPPADVEEGPFPFPSVVGLGLGGSNFDFEDALQTRGFEEQGWSRVSDLMQQGLSFDEARTTLVREQLERAGIGSDGLPMDDRFVTFESSTSSASKARTEKKTDRVKSRETRGLSSLSMSLQERVGFLRSNLKLSYLNSGAAFSDGGSVSALDGGRGIGSSTLGASSDGLGGAGATASQRLWAAARARRRAERKARESLDRLSFLGVLLGALFVGCWHASKFECFRVTTHALLAQDTLLKEAWLSGGAVGGGNGGMGESARGESGLLSGSRLGEGGSVGEVVAGGSSGKISKVGGERDGGEGAAVRGFLEHFSDQTNTAARQFSENGDKGPPAAGRGSTPSGGGDAAGAHSGRTITGEGSRGDLSAMGRRSDTRRDGVGKNAKNGDKQWK